MEKPKPKNDIDAHLAKLKSELQRDDKLYSQKEFIRSHTAIREWCAKVRGLMAGGPGLYEQKDLYDEALKWLSRLDLVTTFFGGMLTVDVIRITEAFQKKIVSLLELELSENPHNNPRPKSVYPRANNGPGFYSCLEMAHHFFNLADDEQILIKNFDTRDHIYHADPLFGGGSEMRFRLPAGGGWVPIPPFMPDPRTDIANPGRFHSAAELFNHRHVLQICIMKKSKSRPPVSIAGEIEAVEIAKQTKAMEVSALISTITTKAEE